MKANANLGTTPWKICWGRWQKEQESSLTWQTIHWERRQWLFCLQKTLRHVKLRLSQGTKATWALKATVNNRHSTSLSKCQQLSPPSSTVKKVHQLLVKSQDFKVPHLQFQHPSGDQRPLLTRHDENFLLSNGLNPGAILPSGNFQNCSFTFNVNVSNGL